MTIALEFCRMWHASHCTNSPRRYGFSRLESRRGTDASIRADEADVVYESRQ